VLLDAEDAFGLSVELAARVRLAKAAATVEQYTSAQPLPEDIKLAFAPSVVTPLSESDARLLGKIGSDEARAAMGALADRGVVLPLRDFVTWYTGIDKGAVDASDAFLSLIAHPEFHDHLNNYEVIPGLASPRTHVAPVIAKLAAEKTLGERAVRSRVVRACLRPGSYKHAFEKQRVPADLLIKYAAYVVSSLHRIAGIDDAFGLTATLAVRQNDLY
jgi:hypothetical protein